MNLYGLNRRLILSAPFTLFTTVSYGLVIFAKETKRWLIVQRKHNVDLLLIVKGHYRITNLPYLIGRITVAEKGLLKNALVSIQNFNHFFLNEMLFNATDLPYAQLRFHENRKIILELLDKIDVSKNTLSWSYPKGRIEYNNGNKESGKQCAIREVKEETGIQIEPEWISPDTYVSETFVSIDGRNIEMRLFLCILEHEIELPNWNNVFHNEIADRKWATTEECLKLLPNDTIIKRVMNRI